MKGQVVVQEIRDQVIQALTDSSSKSGIPVIRLLPMVGLSSSKYHNWKARLGKPNDHNAQQPKAGWILDWEKKAIIAFFFKNPAEGYRRLTYMMIDQDVVAVSPSSVYRVLSAQGLLKRWAGKTGKGRGFDQPLKAHEHWHIDVSYINISGTFYYLCSVLDGFSRFIVHHEIRTAMTEGDIEIILQRAVEKIPGARPRIISDNGPQFIAKDFKEFIKVSGMTHVRTSPFYPQSNGKIERWHQSIKKECIRPLTPTTLKEAQESVAEYVYHYNHERLHSSIGYIAPVDKLEGRDYAIKAERKEKLALAKEDREKLTPPSLKAG